MAPRLTGRRGPRRGPAAAALAVAGALAAGCASQPATLYDWGAYPNALAVHLRESGGDAARQAALLEQQLARAGSTARAAPPGLHAHLALLHTQLGNEARALVHLQAEKALYPESARYVDFLLARAGRTAAAGVTDGTAPAAPPAAAPAAPPASAPT